MLLISRQQTSIPHCTRERLLYTPPEQIPPALLLPKALLGSPLAGTRCWVQSWTAPSLSDFSQFPQPSRLMQLVQAINKMMTSSPDKPAVHKHCRGWSFQGSLPPGSPVWTALRQCSIARQFSLQEARSWEPFAPQMSAKDIKRNVTGKGHRYKMVRKRLICAVIQCSEEASLGFLESWATRTMPRTSGLLRARQEVKTFHRCFHLHRYLQCITDKVCKRHHFYSPDRKTTPQNSAALLSGRARNRAFIPHFVGLKAPSESHCGASSSMKPCSKEVLGGAGPCMLQTPPTWAAPYTAYTAIGSQASLEATPSSDAEH